MPASMIIAPVGSSFMVSGSSIAIVAGGPRPGSTPITVPSTTPITHIVRLLSVRATWNPCSRPETMSMALEEDAVGQREVERELEERIETERADGADDHRGAQLLPAHDLDDECAEERERDHESQHRHERHARRERGPRDHGPGNVLPADLRALRGLEHRAQRERERQHEH